MRSQRSRLLAIAAIALASASCRRYWVCADADESRLAQLPQRLSETGLYSEIASSRVADGVLAYRPQFELWSDGAQKRRWIELPAGQTIDTSDMDDWEFPAGTKIWKEFSLEGKRIETRLLFKKGASSDDWIALAYVWNEAESDAVAAPRGMVDARFGHDVPAAGECFACHGGRKGRVLGFSAVQLSAPAAPGEIGLSELVAQGRLSKPPAAPMTVPGNDVERPALGYLHANCSHCHNATRPSHDGPRCYDPQSAYDFTLRANALDAVANTPTYRTVVGSLVVRGHPDDSKLIEKVSKRGFLKQMPPLATERVDDAGVALLRRWVEGL